MVPDEHTDTPDQLAAAVSELANALQVALPLAARLYERAEAQAQDAERLETALMRATDALRQMQPQREP